MQAKQIRQKFLDFFVSKGHTRQDSAPLIPYNDKTLLFVNSGMVPFKDVFLGREKRAYQCAVSSQRCIRAGGKHNDLENVGYTARHHTFFEMLGNFSFGAYFKKEAIQYAWRFLTEELKLPKDKLWVTVYKDDQEAEDIWVKEIGFAKERISHCGEKDNFWMMGDTGPCGPCSEIFYDHGKDISGGPPGSADEDGDRYIEIWNLVFMQYNKLPNGKLAPLAKPCVDTGMGLERIAAVLQHQHNNYDTDLFSGIIKAINALTPSVKDNPSVNVIADHIRSSVFLIADGVLPDNEGRGYVLRRIIRRAVRHGYKLGIEDLFLHRLVSAVVTEMADAYPLLLTHQDNITEVLKREEQRFSQTLAQGMAILDTAIADLNSSVINGAVVFKLYDTYGFPVDLTADVARERNLTLDLAGFDILMAAQKQRARKQSDFKNSHVAPTLNDKTDFLGYQQLTSEAVVKYLVADDQLVDELNAGDKGMVVLLQSPFYANAGGQEGDRGQLVDDNVCFAVADTQKQPSGAIEHYGILQKGKLTIGQTLNAEVDINWRQNTARNHSATHLLHAALRQVLGKHVVQKGSMIDAHRLRFDFSYDKPLTTEQLLQIEQQVNSHILQNSEVLTEVMGIEAAKQKGALALFGEKYDEQVRVLTMAGDYSIELCGGTHVKRLGDLGLFKIITQSSVAACVRRLEVVTGAGAYAYIESLQCQLNEIATLTKSSINDCADKVKNLLVQNKQLQKQLSQPQQQIDDGEMLKKAISVAGINVLATEVKGVDGQGLRKLVDKFKDKLNPAVVVLAALDNGKVALVAGVSQSLTEQYHASKILNHVAAQIGGNGGGRADMAQGGGNDVGKLSQALASVKTLL